LILIILFFILSIKPRFVFRYFAATAKNRAENVKNAPQPYLRPQTVPFNFDSSKNPSPNASAKAFPRNAKTTPPAAPLSPVDVRRRFIFSRSIFKRRSKSAPLSPVY